MLQNSPLYAYLPAKDVARARAFYEKKIGLKPDGELAGGVTYKFGNGTACFLYPTSNAGTSKASQAFWQVDDVDREIAELKGRGVVFEDYDMDGEKRRAARSSPGAPRPHGSRTPKATSSPSCSNCRTSAERRSASRGAGLLPRLLRETSCAAQSPSPCPLPRARGKGKDAEQTKARRVSSLPTEGREDVTLAF